MKTFRKFLCYLFGHRSICIHRHIYLHDWDNPNGSTSSATGWKCERCGHTFEEGWDE